LGRGWSRENREMVLELALRGGNGEGDVGKGSKKKGLGKVDIIPVQTFDSKI